MIDKRTIKMTLLLICIKIADAYFRENQLIKVLICIFGIYVYYPIIREWYLKHKNKTSKQ